MKIYDINGKVSKAAQGDSLVHALVYNKELGIKSGEIFDIEGCHINGDALAKFPVRIISSWKLPWAVFMEAEWLHEMDLGLRQPDSKAFYLRWWGKQAPEQEILVLLLESLATISMRSAPEMELAAS